ncbi:MAG: hypothetical protein P4L90_25800 [Rhodopila sp.]|nr:hypothetical protein [Rhodopila sp.]
MANKYHVVIGYMTKRGGVALGMDVQAFNDTEAEEIARAKVLDGYPARKWIYTKISDAIGTGCVNI